MPDLAALLHPLIAQKTKQIAATLGPPGVTTTSIDDPNVPNWRAKADLTANGVLGPNGQQAYRRGMDQGIAAQQARDAAEADPVYPLQEGDAPLEPQHMLGQPLGPGAGSAIPGRAAGYLQTKGQTLKDAMRGAHAANAEDITLPDALMYHSLTHAIPANDIKGTMGFFRGPVGAPFYNGINEGFENAGPVGPTRWARGPMFNSNGGAAFLRGVQSTAPADAQLVPVGRDQLNPNAMVRGEHAAALAGAAPPIDLSKPLIVQGKGGKGKAKTFTLPANTAVGVSEDGQAVDRKGKKLGYLMQPVANVRTLQRGNADVYNGDTDSFAQSILGPEEMAHVNGDVTKLPRGPMY